MDPVVYKKYYAFAEQDAEIMIKSKGQLNQKMVYQFFWMRGFAHALNSISEIRAEEAAKEFENPEEAKKIIAQLIEKLERFIS